MKSNKYKTLQGQHLGEKTVGNLKYLLNMLFKSCQGCGGEAKMLPESRISGTFGCSKRGKQKTAPERKGQKLSGEAVKEQKTLEQQTSNTSQPPMETFPWGGYFLQNHMFHMYFISNSCFLY